MGKAEIVLCVYWCVFKKYCISNLVIKLYDVSINLYYYQCQKFSNNVKKCSKNSVKCNFIMDQTRQLKLL